jgi:hypothetical protein
MVKGTSKSAGGAGAEVMAAARVNAQVTVKATASVAAITARRNP